MNSIVLTHVAAPAPDVSHLEIALDRLARFRARDCPGDGAPLVPRRKLEQGADDRRLDASRDPDLADAADRAAEARVGAKRHLPEVGRGKAEIGKGGLKRAVVDQGDLDGGLGTDRLALDQRPDALLDLGAALGPGQA
ncbi:hypothetical protein KUV28_02540 [Ferrimonas balearica]|nr:hypothetical protein [Ferrimonas balearica]